MYAYKKLRITRYYKVTTIRYNTKLTNKSYNETPIATVNKRKHRSADTHSINSQCYTHTAVTRSRPRSVGWSQAGFNKILFCSAI